MKTAALKAWAKSLPLALGIPIIVWMICAAFEGQYASISFALLVITCSAFVHFIAYLLTGLPIFLICHRHPELRIWKLPVALFMGTALGAATMAILFGSEIPSYLLSLLAIGGGYGLATAIAAWRQRPQLQ